MEEKLVLRVTRGGFFGGRKTYEVSANGGGENSPVFPKAVKDTPDWSPDGEWIVFSTKTYGQLNESQIFIVKTGGTNPIQVTNEKRGAIDPSWSNDGNSIIFEGDAGLFTIDIECFLQGIDCSLKPIYFGLGTKADWSPSDRKIVYKSIETGNILVVDVDNPDIEIDVTPHDTSSCNNPKWSPDGSMIAMDCFTDNHDIYVVSWESMETVNITQNPNSTDVKPNWSPDGSRIAFVSDMDDDLGKCLTGECTITARGLYVISTDGTYIIRLSFRNDEDIIWFAWIQ